MSNAGRFNFFIKLAIGVVILFCAVNIIKLRSELNTIKETEADRELQKEEYEEEIDRLKSELEHDMDDEYIMRIAREHGYYLPDEIIFYNDR